MRTKAIHCDRCGQGPLDEKKVVTLMLSPELAKEIFPEDSQYMVDLCPACRMPFVLFMKKGRVVP